MSLKAMKANYRACMTSAVHIEKQGNTTLFHYGLLTRVFRFTPTEVQFYETVGNRSYDIRTLKVKTPLLGL